MTLDPRIAHHIDGRHLLALLPRVPQVELHEVRTEFARFLSTPAGRAHATWQEAWNAFTGATPTRPGVITYTPNRCRECAGRRYSHRNVSRNLARTGNPSVCGECRGTGRGSQVRETARYASAPNTDTDTEKSGA